MQTAEEALIRHQNRMAVPPSARTLRTNTPALSRIVALGVVLGTLATLLAPRRADAQTDFYNTDRDRPVRIEDASVTERYAFELKLAPVRLERSIGGSYRWGVEPELAYGILPRTQVEIGLPLTHLDAVGARRQSGVAGLDVSVMYNLNVESRTLPAFAVRVDALAPVGGLAPDAPYASITGIATRTLSWMRFHVNGLYTAGPAASVPTAGNPGGVGFAVTPLGIDQPRWLAGVAVDKTYPFQSLLVTADLYAQQPLVSAEPVEYTAGTGVRYQWSPTLALDAGVGRRLNGDNQAWYVTFGAAYAFALASLMPGGGR